MLSLVIKGRKNPVRLDKGRITVGRSDSNTVVLDGREVSGYHAEIHCDGGDVYLVDLGSTNGTKVNGKALKEKRKLKAWDTIAFGSTQAEIVDPSGRRPTEVMKPVGAARAASPGAPAAAAGVPWKLVGSQGEFIITGRHVLGREDGCEIRLRSQSVSRRHAELRLKSGRLTVKDLGSSNGTFVNGKRVDQRVLRPQDEVRFDEESFRVHGPTDLNQTSLRPAVSGDPTKVNPAVGAPAGGTRVVRQPAARLEVFAGMSSKSFDLSRDSYTVGRSVQSDIVLPVDSVSARHAELKQSGGVWRLTDLRSTNGTFVNDSRVEDTELKAGDEVRFGEVVLRLVGPEGAMTRTTVQRAATPGTQVQAPAVEDLTFDQMPAAPPKEPSAVPSRAWAAGVVFVVVGVLAFLTWQSVTEQPPPNETVEAAEPPDTGTTAVTTEVTDSTAGTSATTNTPATTNTSASTSTTGSPAGSGATPTTQPSPAATPPPPAVERRTPSPPPARTRTTGASLRGGTARLVVNTSPQGVKVSLNGEPVGVTPLELEGLTPGTRTLVLDHDVYRRVRLTNQVLVNDETLRVDRRMVFGLGKLTVVATPRDVMVEVDGLLKATTTPFTIDDVRAGRRRVTLRALGYETMVETVEIRKGEITELERTLTPER